MRVGLRECQDLLPTDVSPLNLGLWEPPGGPAYHTDAILFRALDVHLRGRAHPCRRGNVGALQATLTPRECYTTPRNAFYLTPSGVLLERDLCMGQPTGGATGNRGPEHRDTRGHRGQGPLPQPRVLRKQQGFGPKAPSMNLLASHLTHSPGTPASTPAAQTLQNYIQGPLLFSSLLFYPGSYQFSLPSFCVYTFKSSF